VAAEVEVLLPLVDGADTTQGLKADAAVINPASTASLISILKGCLTFLSRLPSLGQSTKSGSIPITLQVIKVHFLRLLLMV